MLELIWLVPLLPLAGAIAVGLAGRRLGERTVGLVACLAVAASFLVAASGVVEFARERWSPDAYTVYRSDEAGKGLPGSFVWIPGGAALTADERPVPGGVTVEWVYAVDALTCVMLLVVPGVGLLVHVFATAYMRGDSGYARFFVYLNLVVFAMLVLVLASNFPMMLVGWEGVGLCSYLLVGLWYERVSAAGAAKKAFVANRIGDVGLLLGMFGLFALFGTFEFAALRDAIAPVEAEQFGQFGLMSLVALGLFVGAAGKSAQIPLFVWLPDALPGPTPISALVHAATTVTAGVYMLARLGFVFLHAPTMLLVVAVVGSATALLGAAAAFAPNYTKKVLAYSTVSRLGPMVNPVGFVVWLSRRAQRFDDGAVDATVDGLAWGTRRSSIVTEWVDRYVVDGAVRLASFALYGGSLVLRAAQTGLFQSYALAIVLGLVALVVLLEWSAIAGLIARFAGGGQ
jgi:NADH-quinone oxidoreductase subunit L